MKQVTFIDVQSVHLICAILFTLHFLRSLYTTSYQTPPSDYCPLQDKACTTKNLKYALHRVFALITYDSVASN